MGAPSSSGESMQVSSRGEKAKETKEEIEKALLTYCSQLGDLAVWRGGYCATLLPLTRDGHVNTAGFSVLHQPNVAIPRVMTGELKEKNKKKTKLHQIFQYAKPANLSDLQSTD